MKYRQVVENIIRKNFKELDLNKYLGERPEKSIIFVHGNNQTYDMVPNLNSLRDILKDYLTQYNDCNAKLNLVLFDEALKQVCRIARILRSD